MSDFLITVVGEAATGKTTILDLILSTLADNGLLTVGDTKRYTEHPRSFMAHTRIDNTDSMESIDIEIDGDALMQFGKNMRDYRVGIPDVGSDAPTETFRYVAREHDSGWWVVIDTQTGREIDDSGDGGLFPKNAEIIANALNRAGADLCGDWSKH
jgi:hypothetical protein